jgi:spore maturation protein CgeB
VQDRSQKVTKVNWNGPYRIMEKKTELTYRIRRCSTWKEEVVNINRLKLAERIVLTEEERKNKRENESKLIDKPEKGMRSKDKTKHFSF